MEAIGNRYQHITAMNCFDKVVAQHLISVRKDELIATHEDRQIQINRLVDALNEEAEELHQISDYLNSKQSENEASKQEINVIRLKCQNLKDIKHMWVKILRQKFTEARTTNILKIFVLIKHLAKLKDTSVVRERSTQ